MSQARFLELDGMRGVAAFAIVLFHFTELLSEGPLLPSAYLAVDFFFMLSGFVLDYAYGPRLAKGGAFWRFTRARLTRLYPLYALGLALGLAYLLMRLLLSPMQGLTGGQIGLAALLSALLLPNLAPPAPLQGTYPINLPAWSLALEIGINLVFAAIFPWLTLRRIAGIVALGGVLLLVLAGAAGTGSFDLGAKPATLPGGIGRVLFGFFAGVLVHRLYQRTGAAAVPAVPSVVLMALLCIIFAIDLHGPARLVFDAAMAFVALPAVLWLGAGARAWAPLAWLTFQGGRLSYAVYILHFPVLLLLIAVMRVVLHIDPVAWKPWSGLGSLAITLVVCYAVDRTLEQRLRFWASRFQRRRAAAHEAAAMAGLVPKAENPP